MKIFYWNVNGKPFTLSAAFKHAELIDADILIFVECPLLDYSSMTRSFVCVEKMNSKNSVQVFCRTCLKEDIKNAIQDDSHSSYYVFQKKIVFCVAHLMSDCLHNNRDHRDIEINKMAKSIDGLQATGVSPVFIVGDINANLFDNDVFCPDKLSVTFFENQILSDSPMIEGEFLKLYYSPSLDIYFDRKNQNKGCATFFYDGCLYKWAFLDNLLMNKDAFSYYKKESFFIVDEVLNEKLVNDYRIKNNLSDHLPLCFNICLEE